VGGAEAFDWSDFFERYRAVAVRFARSLVRDADTADDLFQEAARSLYARAASGALRFDSHVHARNYLFRAIRNLASNHVRRADGRATTGLDDELELPSPDPAPIDSLLASERHLARERRRQEMERALASLAPKEVAVLQLRFGEQLTLAEISHRLGAPLSTVHSRLEAALSRIRKRIGKTALDE
jgi:RNA polymerase sigma-70 factor (ECF subfamily)